MIVLLLSFCLQIEAYRGEVVSDVGCAIVISLLECCKKNPMATREVMVAIRSICSAERNPII